MNFQDIKIKKIDTGDIAMLKSNIKNNDENLLLLVNETLNFFNPIQDGLNKELCKNDNYAKELSTNTGKLINFGNCIISEGNELLDCTPWKHWKSIDDEINYSNFELETADMFHFGPSVFLCLHDIYPGTQKLTNPVLTYTKNIILNFIDNEFIYFVNQEQGLNKAVLETIASWATYIGTRMSQMFRVKLYSNESETLFWDCTRLKTMAKQAVPEILAMMHTLISIHSMLFGTTYKMSLERIKAIYVVKNCLNKLRSKNGYKEGFYIKDWFGKEDNEAALEIAETTEGLGINVLMEKLDIKYAEVVEAHKRNK